MNGLDILRFFLRRNRIKRKKAEDMIPTGVKEKGPQEKKLNPKLRAVVTPSKKETDLLLWI